MLEIFRSLRPAARQLLRTPGFTLLVVLLLGVSIGATVAVFSMVDGALWKPLPFADAEALVVLQRTTDRGSYSSFAPAELVDFRTRLEGFTGAAGYDWQSLELTREGGDEGARMVGVASVSSDFFSLLGVVPHLGRTFTPGEGAAGAEARAVVVSHRFYRRYFGDSGEAALGSTVDVAGQRHTILGVLPRGFDLPSGADLWVRGEREIPRPMQPITGPGEDITAVRNMSYFSIIARLEPGRSLEQGEAALEALRGSLLEAHPQKYRERRFTLNSLRAELSGNVQQQLHLLLGAVLVVLLIACANVASLLLARATAREREAAIRSALGAGRGRLLLGSLAEAGWLAAAGGGLGTLMAYLGLDALVALAPGRLPGQEVVAVDGRVLLFALALTMATALLAGILPAWQTSSLEASRCLGEGSRGSDGRRRHRLRHGLVVVEVALALVLLIGAGLLMVSLFHLRSNSPGFRAEGLVMARLNLPPARYPDAVQRSEFFRRAVEGAGGLPGVQQVALGGATPFSGSSVSYTFEAEGHEGTEERMLAAFTAVSPGYFRTLEIPILEGRAFLETDLQRAAEVVLVSRSLADRYYPEGALGRRLLVGGSQGDGGSLIVGVVGDVRQYGLDAAPEPTIYQLFPESDWHSMVLLIRAEAAGDTLSTVVGAVRDQIRILDPLLPVEDIVPMTRRIDRTLAERHALMVVLGIFATVALSLAAVGLYALLAYSVRQRSREIGIRMALGARRRSVVAMVVGQGLALVGIGVFVGWGAAVAATRVLRRYLFGIEAVDPVVFGALAVMLLAVAALAGYLPARRAARIDPNEALRHE